MRFTSALKMAVVLSAALTVAACSDDEPAVSSTDSSSSSAIGSGSDSNSGMNQASFRPGSLEEFQQGVGDRVFFDYDQYNLSDEGQAVLAKQAQWIKQYAGKNQLVIEGHCDERGTREYNLALGARRANSVKSFLVSQGISARQIKTISYGKERAEVPGSDEMSWAKNRRGVTVLVDYNN